MKVTAIEIAEAIEKEITRYLNEASDRSEMRFTRFIDLGGKQLDVYLYPPVSGATVWSIIGIKSVHRDEQGDCMIYNVSLPDSDRRFEYVQVSPVEADLPEIAKKIVDFLRDDLKAVNEGVALEGGKLALGGNENGGGGPDGQMVADGEEPDAASGESEQQDADSESVEESESGDSKDSDQTEPEDEAAKETGA